MIVTTSSGVRGSRRRSCCWLRRRAMASRRRRRPPRHRRPARPRAPQPAVRAGCGARRRDRRSSRRRTARRTSRSTTRRTTTTRCSSREAARATGTRSSTRRARRSRRPRAPSSSCRPGGARDSKYAARMMGKVSAAGDPLFAGMGFSFTDPKGPYDASAYTGVSFYAQGRRGLDEGRPPQGARHRHRP